MDIIDIALAAKRVFRRALKKNWGAENFGKILAVGESGDVQAVNGAGVEVMTADDVLYSGSATYDEGTVGETLKETAADVSQLKSEIAKLEQSSFAYPNVVLGSVNSSGEEIDSTNRARTGKIAIDSLAFANTNTNYKNYLFAYNGTTLLGTSAGGFQFNNFTAASIKILFPAVTHVNIVYSKTDSSVISSTDIKNIQLLVRTIVLLYEQISQNTADVQAAKTQLPFLTSAAYSFAEVEVGGIASSDGSVSESDYRARTKEYIPIESFIDSTFVSGAIKNMMFAYDSSKTLLGTSASGFQYNTFTNQSVLALYPSCKFVKVSYSKTDSTIFDATDFDALSKVTRISTNLSGEIESIDSVKDWHCNTIQSVAHQGYHAKYSNNTIDSLIAAAKKGFRFCEMDVKVTSDGKYVICHDATIYVNTTTNKIVTESTGTAFAIASHTYDELKVYTYSNVYKQTSTVPLLFDMLKMCKIYGINPYVELSANLTEAQIREIVDYIKSIRLMDKTVFTSGGIVNIITLATIYDDAVIAYQPTAHMPPLTDFTAGDGTLHGLYTFAQNGRKVIIRLYVSDFEASELANLTSYALSLAGLGFNIAFSIVDDVPTIKEYGFLADYILSNDLTMKDALS